MTFFLDPDILLSTKMLEMVYLLMGVLLIITGLKNLRDSSNPQRLGTAIFWGILGTVIAFGHFIPNQINGLLIFLMVIPAISQRVSRGASRLPSKEIIQANAEKVGHKIFIPALSIGFSAIGFALFTTLGALVGIAFGVGLAIVMLMLFSKNNTPAVFLDDLSEMLGTVGPLCMLPMLLASLGAVFTSAGVGELISEVVEKVVPVGNVNLGIIVYALGMVIFTAIMGNSFAAITVITVGIGEPFVLSQGADPALIGMVALTCGSCGTLLTPMAANFNIVPVAMLEMKDNYGVIKNQWFIAIWMLVFQIGYMMVFKFSR
ncbi:MAG: DUF979 domain-containing protein [Enterococcus sp.]